MACGDRYAYLITNDRGGTPSEVCKYRCEPKDVESWNRAALLLRDDWVMPIWKQHLNALEQLVPIDQGTPMSDHPKMDSQLYVDVGEYVAGTMLLQVPVLFDERKMYDQSLRAVDSMKTGTCLIERIVDWTAKLGFEVTTPETPPKAKPTNPENPGQPVEPPKSDASTFGTVVAVGVLGAGALGTYKLIKYFSNRRGSTPALTE